MKKMILSIVAFISLTSLLNAQGRKGLWVAPNFNFGPETMTDIYPNNFTPDASATIGVGADVYWMFNNHIGVGSGLQFSDYGYQWSNTNASGNWRYKGQQQTIDIPIYARFVTGSGGGFFANVGCINHFLTSAEEKVYINENQVTNATGKDAKNDFRKYNASIFAYFGGNIRCGNKVQLTLGPQISYELGNNFSKSSNLDGHHLTFAVKVGVGIHAYGAKRKGN